MLKRLAAAILFLAVMCSVSQATTVVSDYRYVLAQDLLDDTYANYLYNLYGNETGFNYQLRELTGRNTAGSQWFATVYENYYYHLYNVGENVGNRSVYRRTTGGEIPEIPISAIGNIIGGFNFMTVEENQPYDYRTWVNVYDQYPDPVESFCLVIKNGTGNFDVNFGNPYASHFPYWWHWTLFPNSANWYDRGHVQSINEPVIFWLDNANRKIWQRGDDGYYTEKYAFALSNDVNASGDVISSYYIINDLDGKLAYRTSGDTLIDTDRNVIYTVADSDVFTRIYNNNNVAGLDINNPDGELLYKVESEGTNVYICELRAVTESVRIDGFEDYTFRFNPSNEQSVNPGDYYSTNVQINSAYGSDYGSTLGYITFNQRADLLRGYTRYRENTTIPMVIANVADGNAADVPLQFNMTVYDNANDKTADHVVNRVKFTWDAQSNMNQDFGTFFMIQSSADPMPTYYLETQITNRTGTRYRLYRYDMLGRTTGYQEILPEHWKYDLPLSPAELKRETLPQYFHLDAHSQIAPGLVTVYDHEVYGTVNTAYDTYESFQLSEYDSPNPKNLRLDYKRIRGMDLLTEENLSGVRVREFAMRFADTIRDNDETAYELQNLMGKPHVMTTASVSASSVTASAPSPRNAAESHDTPVTIDSRAIDAFRFKKNVPLGLVTYTIISEDVGSDDNSGSNESDDRGSSPAEVKITIISNEIPIQPLSIRMRVPRQNQLVIDHWAEFENAANSEALFNAFARYCAVWLRVDTNTANEGYTNFFTAINNKGANIGAGISDCFKAFIYEDELYLDFIVMLADGKSTQDGKTAYVELFRDDGVPYILIGDGKENGVWDMTFYISAQGNNPSTRDDEEQNNNNNNNTNNSSEGGGGGGGCDSGLLGMLGTLIIACAALKLKK